MTNNTNFYAYWMRLTISNKALNQDSQLKMTLSIAEFRRQLEKAYKKGAEEATRPEPQPEKTDPLKSLFGDLLR